uniref:Putative salivary secreted peptide of the HHH family n=1 Tax=Ochlerotatus triseriatus TaxID=7162 RepID=C6ZQV8_OCHTR
MKLLLILGLAVIAVVAFALPDHHRHHQNGTVGGWAGRWNRTAVNGQQFNRTVFAGGRRWRPRIPITIRPRFVIDYLNGSRPVFPASANITDGLF